MATVPTKEPQQITAGDRLLFRIYDSCYSPGEYQISYALVRDGEQITFTGSNNGDGFHLVDVDSVTTLGWGAGTYKFQAYFTHLTNSPTERVTARRGTIEVLEDFETSTAGYDGRSHVKKTLDALEATIEGKASSDQLSYSIAGRSISKMTPEELWQWRGRYKEEYAREVAAEELGRGLGSGNIVRVRRYSPLQDAGVWRKWGTE